MGKGDRFMEPKFSFGPLRVTDEQWEKAFGVRVVEKHEPKKPRKRKKFDEGRSGTGKS